MVVKLKTKLFHFLEFWHFGDTCRVFQFTWSERSSESVTFDHHCLLYSSAYTAGRTSYFILPYYLSVTLQKAKATATTYILWPSMFKEGQMQLFSKGSHCGMCKRRGKKQTKITESLRGDELYSFNCTEEMHWKCSISQEPLLAQSA